MRAAALTLLAFVLLIAPRPAQANASEAAAIASLIASGFAYGSSNFEPLRGELAKQNDRTSSYRATTPDAAHSASCFVYSVRLDPASDALNWVYSCTSKPQSQPSDALFHEIEGLVRARLPAGYSSAGITLSAPSAAGRFPWETWTSSGAPDIILQVFRNGNGASYYSLAVRAMPIKPMIAADSNAGLGLAHTPLPDGTYYWKFITSEGLRWCQQSRAGQRADARIELLSVEVMPRPNVYIMHCRDQTSGAKLDFELNIVGEPYPRVTAHPGVAITTADPNDPGVADRLCRGVDVNFLSVRVEKQSDKHYRIRCLRTLPTRRDAQQRPDDDEAFVEFFLPVEIGEQRKDSPATP